jgi:hypothetical protein
MDPSFHENINMEDKIDQFMYDMQHPVVDFLKKRAKIHFYLGSYSNVKNNFFANFMMKEGMVSVNRAGLCKINFFYSNEL